MRLFQASQSFVPHQMRSNGTLLELKAHPAPSYCPLAILCCERELEAEEGEQEEEQLRTKSAYAMYLV